MKKIFCAASIIVFPFLPVISYAADSPTDTYVFDLKNLEVDTVSKKPEKAFESASAVYVITSEQINRSGATSIAEALKLAPGIEVGRISSNKWAVSARGFNRQFSNKLLVMIDGKTFYAPLFAGTFWDTLDTNLEDIDRIEVIRGSGGTLWGANAVNGVINIITKNAKFTQGSYVSTTVGTFENNITEGRMGSKIGNNIYYRAYGKYFNNSDTSRINLDTNANDQWNKYSGGFRFDKDISNTENLMIKADFYNGSEDQDLVLPGITEIIDNDEHFKGASIVSKWEKQLSERSTLILNGFVDNATRHITFLDVNTSIAEFNLQNDFKINNSNDLIWGFGYRGFINNIDNKPIQGTVFLTYTPQELDANLYNIFVQNKTNITNNLVLTLGSKFEYNYYTNLEYQPSAKLSWNISNDNVLWASISRAVRIPSLAETGINMVASPTLTNVGNPNYDSEGMLSYELGFRSIVTNNLSLDTTIYYNKYTNLRTFKNPPLITLDNQGSANIIGAEQSFEYLVTKDLTLSGSFSIAKNSFDLDAGISDVGGLFYSDETISPSYQIKLQSNYNILENIQFDNYFYIKDEISSSPTKNIKGYNRFDSRIAWKVNKKVELSFVGQNLLDDKHQEFSEAIYSYPTEISRSIYLKLKYNIN